jgi:hypothetical protein
MNDNSRWFHLILTTYGSWLYGDHRGFRTRHHREHVEGDYKNPPPPGLYEAREERSRRSLKQPPVVLAPASREVVGRALKERLQGLGALVVCLAVAKRHAHVLVKMPREQVRSWGGAAKRHAWFELRKHGWQGKLWGKRGRGVPVRDRAHQLNVYRYILAHAAQGAWTWTMVEKR